MEDSHKTTENMDRRTKNEWKDLYKQHWENNNKNIINLTMYREIAQIKEKLTWFLSNSDERDSSKEHLLLEGKSCLELIFTRLCLDLWEELSKLARLSTSGNVF